MTQHEKVIIFCYLRGVTTDLLDVKIYCQYYPAIWGVISNTPTLWKRNGNTLPRVGMNLSGLGVQIASGGLFSNTSLLLAVYYYNVALGEEMYCKLHPNWLGSIDSVEFKTLSL